MHPLDGPRLKVARAEAEIDRLRLMEDAFFEDTHYSVVRAEQDLESGEDIHRVEVDGPPLSLCWGLHIGEIAHNLRSALDHLVYQLALLNSSDKSETFTGHRRLQFPIELASDAFEGNWKDTLELLRSEHKTRIERLQPYQGSNSASLKTVDLTEWSGRRSPLFRLKEINNADKHRVIQVAGARPRSLSFNSWVKHPGALKATWGVFGILEDGAEFGRCPTGVVVNTQLHMMIAFAHGCPEVRAQFVCPLLAHIATTVSEIIDSFASEF